MACKDKYTELSNSFDDMVNKCIYTMVELKKFLLQGIAGAAARSACNMGVSFSVNMTN